MTAGDGGRPEMTTVSSSPRSAASDDIDLLVFGAGAAGMTAALVAALDGLKVVLCEKTDMVGGTTSTSGGTTWIPGTHAAERAGVPDSVDDAARFLASVVGTRGGDDLRAAFLASGPEAVRELEERTEVRFIAATAHPDYLGNHPGAAFGGRALTPVEFDGRLLGEDFDRVRPPRREFLGLSGMMVARGELPALLAPFASFANLRTTLSIVLRHLVDRLSYRRGTRLLMGNALVARLFHSLRKQGVDIRFDTALEDLLIENGRVAGAVVKGPAGRQELRARRGVVLATGGVAWNTALRQRFYPAPTRDEALAPVTNTGDGAAAAMRIGAQADAGGDSAGFWMPCSQLDMPDGTRLLWPHILLDRAKPGLIAVNAAGRRFVNEADSYHDFCMGALRSHETTPTIPAWLVCDAAFIRDYGLGLVLPGARGLKRFLRLGYLAQAPSLDALAGRIGVDAAQLKRTVAEHNGYAATGVDEAFGRGSSPMNRFNGDPANKPNPCMRPIARAPFYAVAVRPVDLASSAGLRGDPDGRVLDADGRPIDGLYACGNDMTSIFRGTYPGPGTTLGPAIVFGWRVAKHAARPVEAAHGS